MSNSESVVNAPYALYIKLGRSGNWENACLEQNILRFGYTKTPYDAAVAGDWDTVLDVWREERDDIGAATRDLAQIKHFFADGDDVLWITFSKNLLWWCFAKPGARVHPDGGTYRECVEPWNSMDAEGKLLSMDKLSGSLLRVQGFRGTICEVKALDYLKRKLNGETLPEVEAAREARNNLVIKIVPSIQHLTWQDFELLVDLVFSNSGWRRISQLGKTQKTIDIELLLPTTRERAFVQIKSSTSKQELDEYHKCLQESPLYSRMFFVWHTGNISEVTTGGRDNVTLIGPEALAAMVVDAGLTSWLLEKVS